MRGFVVGKPGILFCEDARLKVLFQDVQTAFDMRVQRTPRVDLLAALISTFKELEIARNAAPFRVIEEACTLIANPGVGATAARVDPEDVLEAEVFAKSNVEGLDCHGYEPPAFEAYARACAACSYIVVICHVDIENELFHDRSECARFAHRLAVARVCGVLGSNFETRR
jgi:hypothetical protein